jgi:hypothetical protein
MLFWCVDSSNSSHKANPAHGEWIRHIFSVILEVVESSECCLLGRVHSIQSWDPSKLCYLYFIYDLLIVSGVQKVISPSYLHKYQQYQTYFYIEPSYVPDTSQQQNKNQNIFI